MRAVCVSVVAGLMGIASAPATAQCLQDADGDGHPLFRSLNRRVDVQYIDSVPSSAWPKHMAFGDLDDDGDLDGAFVSAAAGEYLTILLNRGDAVFDAPTAYDTGAGPRAVALGDVDADGDLDVAVVNVDDQTLSVFLNAGDGTLGPQSVHAVGDDPGSVVAADLNADGLADLAVLNTGSDDVSVFMATGGGAFAPEVRVDVGIVTPKYPVPFVPGPFLAAADLEGDGDVDLVVPAVNRLRILRNDGAGTLTFEDEILLGLPEMANAVTVADFDTDGLPDLAAVVRDDNYTPAVIAVVFQTDDDTWADPVIYDGAVPLGQLHGSIAAGDIDHDGAPDIVAGQWGGDPGIELFMNDGAGGFEASEHPSIQFPWVVALEDLDADGWVDLAFLGGPFSGFETLQINLNDGAGTLVAPAASPDAGDLGQICHTHRAAAAADLDLDGDLDVVGGLSAPTCSRQVNIYENEGTGTFSVAGEISLVPMDGGAIVQDLETADLNGDGWPDVVVVDEGPFKQEDRSPGVIWTLLSRGGLEFASPVELPLETVPFGATVADFDGDGHPDLAVASRA